MPLSLAIWPEDATVCMSASGPVDSTASAARGGRCPSGAGRAGPGPDSDGIMLGNLS
jgi:hypothetical protein